VFTVGFSVYSVFRHWHFHTSYDLGIFDQAIWHLSRFERPASTISGVSNILGDHFYPVVFLFAPLYWIAPAPETLLVAQAVLFAASIVPVFWYLRTRLPRGVAYMLTIAYGLYWGIQRANAADVHEVAFAPLIIATAVVAMDQRRCGLFWTMAGLLVLVKEDLILLLGAIGVLRILAGDHRRGLALAATSLVSLIVVVGLVVPWFRDHSRSAYVSLYDDLAASPLSLPLRLVTPAVKVETAILWFLPFLFLSLASPLSILVVPIALARLLSDNPNHWGTSFHYSAPLAPLVAMSAGDGLARIACGLERRGRSRLTIRRWIHLAAAICLLLSAVLPGRQPLWRVFMPKHYRMPLEREVGREALAVIPQDRSVLAQAAIVPHLSHRFDVFVLGRAAPDTDYVVAAAVLSYWPAKDYSELRALLRERQQRGYAVVFDRKGWTVLRGPRVAHSP
jgi:uncharacterized membrane protein